jgi:hypothetical protein
VCSRGVADGCFALSTPLPPIPPKNKVLGALQGPQNQKQGPNALDQNNYLQTTKMPQQMPNKKTKRNAQTTKKQTAPNAKQNDRPKNHIQMTFQEEKTFHC